jgi:hypothetical protein
MNVAAGRGFEMGGEPRFDRGAFKREPLYPLFLAGLIRTGHFLTALLASQILLFGATVLAAYRVFRFCGAPGVAWPAAALFALHPYAYWYVAKPTPENFSPLILLLSLWAFHKYLGAEKLAAMLVWGGLCGMAILIKSQLIILFPIGLLLLFGHRGYRRSILPAGTAALVCILMLSPWAIRNYRLSHKLMVSSSMFGTSFFLGNENANWKTVKEVSTHLRGETSIAADWKMRYAQLLAQGAEKKWGDKYTVEAQIDSEYSRQVLPWILSHKIAFFRKLMINASILWFIADEPAKSILIAISLLPVLALCLAGMWHSWKITIFEIHLVAIICTLYASYSATVAMGRYMHVALPLECYFSVLGLRALWAWRSEKRRRIIAAHAFDASEAVAGRAV